ncbi:hypothetical protein [Burkholderia cepacia]|uniref:hypothetical protein n=1 Tax=Burkholderia cepacia TaxID=292 RepID=UPI0012D97921|nr:hypothetical protein [Burkholderia cepacia]
MPFEIVMRQPTTQPVSLRRLRDEIAAQRRAAVVRSLSPSNSTGPDLYGWGWYQNRRNTPFEIIRYTGQLN